MKLVDAFQLRSGHRPWSEYSVLAGMIALLPVLVLLSGMAMTPYLVLLVLLVVGEACRTRKLDFKALLREGAVTLVVLGLIVVWPALSIAWSITPAASLVLALKTITIMLAGAVGLLVCRQIPGLARGSAIAFAASILVCGLLVLLEQLPRGGILALGYDLFSANFDKFIHKNINRGLCALAVLVWPAALALDRAGLKPHALILPWIVALPVAVMHSLSAKLALISGLAVFYALRAFPVRGARVLVIVVPVFLALWPVGFSALYQPLFAAPAIYQRLPDSSQARVDIWHFVSGKILERPLLGWGLDSSRAIPGGTTEYVPGRTYLPLHPHNSALQVLLEEGVLGFALTLAGLTVTLFSWKRKWTADPTECAAGGALIVAYLVVGFSAFGIWQTWWISTAWIAAMIFEIARRGQAEA